MVAKENIKTFTDHNKYHKQFTNLINAYYLKKNSL